jgi:hypothetical protein
MSGMNLPLEFNVPENLNTTFYYLLLGRWLGAPIYCQQLLGVWWP